MVDTLQDIISKKCNVPKFKQILKFKRDGITFKLIAGWPLSHYGLEDRTVIFLETLQVENKTPSSEKKELFVKTKGEYFSKLGIFERKQEDFEEESESPESYYSLLNGTKHLSLPDVNSFNEGCDVSRKTASRSSGSVSILSHAGQKMINIKDIVILLIKEAKAFNKTGILEILSIENNDAGESDNSEELRELYRPEAKNIINEKSEHGWSLFHWSVHLGQVDICTELLRLGADPTVKTADGWTPLQLAVYKNNVDLIKLLLNVKEVNVNDISCKGTALHIAAKNGKAPIVSLLISSGADPSIDIPNEGTAFKVATNAKVKQIINATNLKRLAEIQIAGAPYKVPMIKGWMYSQGELLFQMCPRYFVINPEEGTFARYRKKEDFPNRPRDIIPLKDIEAVQRKKPSTFCDKSLFYLEVQYLKKYTMACNNEEVANQWQYYIVQGSIYATYIEEKLKKELISNDKMCLVESCMRMEYQTEIELFDEKSEELKTDTLSTTRTRADTIPTLSDLPPLQSKEENQILQEDNCQIHFNESEMSLDSFDILKVLGVGSFGKVFMVRQKTSDTIYALKDIKINNKKEGNQLSYILTEAQILKKIKHPFIVNLHHTFQTEGHFYLVLDYCSRGDLANFLSKKGKLREEEASLFVAELIQAIEYLHSLNIIYRDLKPENILLDARGHIKLADFGLAKEGICNNEISKSFCGSPVYLPPEVLFNSGVGKAGDIYGIGIILYEMLTGRPPFYSEQIPILYNYIKNAPLQFPSGISCEAKDLLQKLLVRDPKQRVGVQDKSEIKKHPFFKNINWNILENKKFSLP